MFGPVYHPVLNKITFDQSYDFENDVLYIVAKSEYKNFAVSAKLDLDYFVHGNASYLDCEGVIKDTLVKDLLQQADNLNYWREATAWLHPQEGQDLRAYRSQNLVSVHDWKEEGF